MTFQQTIIEWYHRHRRDLPWRNTNDPYIIWLSEVILQQTRVEQGLPYFNKFITHFPAVKDFASATEDEVLKLWQGLGYYSRGRNMLHTARAVCAEYGGVFPRKYAELIKLKGIGAYTAAAISSFSGNENQAVVDGNVYRVLARFFDIEEAINSTQGRKIFSMLAQELVEGQEAAVYNQAIMEFGALQCKPHKPDCGICPLLTQCMAYREGSVERLPLKLKNKPAKERWFNYFIATEGERVYTKQRQAGDIWQKLYDFPLIETGDAPGLSDEAFVSRIRTSFGEAVVVKPLYKVKRILSHQIIYVHFFALENYMINFKLHPEIKAMPLSDFRAMPHPKVIGDFMEKYFKI